MTHRKFVFVAIGLVCAAILFLITPQLLKIYTSLQLAEHYVPAAGLKLQPQITMGLENDRCEGKQAGAVRLMRSKGTYEICTLNGWKYIDACVAKMGSRCVDGTVFVGISPDTNEPMFATPCDATGYLVDGACRICEDSNQLWSGLGEVCEFSGGARSGVPWSNADGEDTSSEAASYSSGKDNTKKLLSRTDARSQFVAASYCGTLRAYGHTDWYLPARDELALAMNALSLTTASGQIDRRHISSERYWSSTEEGASGAWFSGANGGITDTSGKDRLFGVQCVRQPDIEPAGMSPTRLR